MQGCALHTCTRAQCLQLEEDLFRRGAGTFQGTEESTALRRPPSPPGPRFISAPIPLPPIPTGDSWKRPAGAGTQAQTGCRALPATARAAPRGSVSRLAPSRRAPHCHPLLYNTVIISLNHIVIHCGFCLRLPKLPLHISAAIKPIKRLVVKWCTVVGAGAGRNCVIPYCG